MLALVRRRLLLVVLTAVAVAVLAYLLAGLRPVTHQADSTLLVESGGGAGGPGQANEALRLAFTYAEVIPRDADLLTAVAGTLQVPVSEVRENLSVGPIGDTALLRVSYTSADRAQAVAGSRFAAESVLEGTTTSDTVARGSVSLVGLAEDESVITTGGVSSSTVPIGLVLGLALGGILAAAAERANRRVDNTDQAGATLDAPVLDLDAATTARREALVRRWSDAGQAGAPTVVSVTGAATTYGDLVECCHRMAEGLPREQVMVAQDGLRRLEGTAPGTVVLVPAGVPGSGDPHEEVTARADLVVLVLPRSVQRSAVRRTVSDLVTYADRRPDHLLLTSQARPSKGPRSVKDERTDRASDAEPERGTVGLAELTGSSRVD